MKSKALNYLFLPAMGLLILGGGLTSVKAKASETNFSKSDLVKHIASKFNLKEEDVKAVFEEHQNKLQDDMEDRYASYLQKLVENGQITKEQSDKLQAKHHELLMQRPDFSGKTREEIKELMDKKNNEIKEWAESNNIPLKYLRMGHKLAMKQFRQSN